MPTWKMAVKTERNAESRLAENKSRDCNKKYRYTRLPPSYTYHAVIITLSLRFNGHFPSEPGLAGVYWSKGWWR